VLGAATPLVRLGVVRDIREQQWLNSLPPAQRAKLTGLSPNERGELVRQWKEEEARRRDLWAFARRHADIFIANSPPWPFDTEAARTDVPEFVRAAFRIDDSTRCRLSSDELNHYREALEAAQKSGEWAWYGKTVYDLARKYETLPEPADPNALILDSGTLPPTVSRMLRPGVQKRLAAHAGKWPDFALEVHRELHSGKFPAALPPLGPAKMADFTQPVREFWEKELSPKLNSFERNRLRMLENRWPEYPREFVQLARQHDLSVPGVMLPGSPRRWDMTYGSGTRPPVPFIRPFPQFPKGPRP
jgi:hypothetical protein